MLQRFRERLALLLLLALPFHAFGVTVLTRLIAGPAHAPLAILALWKEALLCMILGIISIEIIHQAIQKSLKKALIDPIKKFFGFRSHSLLNLDFLDCLVLILILLGIVVSMYNYALRTTHYSLATVALGFKYDLLPLITFLLARRVPWSEWFTKTIGRWLLIIGVGVAAFGILSFVLPSSLFVALGYSPVNSLYFTDAPLAAFQMIGDTKLHRIQSVMSGPNQLGLWLILPWCIALTRIGECRRNAKTYPRLISYLAATLVIGLALILTFSRTAWIGVFVATLVALSIALPSRLRRDAILSLVASTSIIGIIAMLLFPNVLFRLGSSRGHFERPIEGMYQMIAHPFGQGLGTAGPASHRGRDACVMLRQGDDPAWARNMPDLCVFVGDTQVQPKDHTCLCPFLPENWYVQIGVETGVVGFVLFITLTIMLLMKLWKKNFPQSKKQSSKTIYPLPITHYPFLAFVGLSIAALFLHAWEDAAIAYSLWMLVGISMGNQRKTQ